MANNEEPKIIVDDDWKSQVEKEKEQLKSEASASSPDEAEEALPQEMPPASFPMLISTLATQSMASMGMLPDPRTGEASAHKPMAKHFIDTLGMLQDKTSGNLSEEESTMLRDTLHQLRMAYMAVPDTPPAEPKPEEKKSSIELP